MLPTTKSLEMNLSASRVKYIWCKKLVKNGNRTAVHNKTEQRLTDPKGHTFQNYPFICH